MIGIGGAGEGGGISAVRSVTSKCRSFWQAAKKRLADNCIFGLSVVTLSHWFNHVDRSAGQCQTLFKQHCNASGKNVLLLSPVSSCVPAFSLYRGRTEY